MEVLTVCMFFVLLVQLPGINTQECGVAPLNTKIVGGENATTGTWPWQVSLHYNGAHICGATVIDKEWVLTAAHCINNTDARNYTLYFGKETQSGNNPHEVNRTVTQIIVHAAYDSEKITNDIALMKLSSPLVYNNYIRPVCLATNNSVFNNGTTCWATGWGRLSGDAPLVAHDVLQEVSIPIIGNNLCGCIYRDINSNNITSNMICAGVQGRGICQGDSGGPVQCKQGNQWIQAGISSFGIPCALGIPEVFARVSFFASWISSHANGSNVSFVEYKSSGPDPDDSFVCTLSTNTTSTNTTSPNTTSTAFPHTVPSGLTFAGAVMTILLMPFFA